MSDVVRCTAVLQKSADPSRPDHLYLVLPPDFRPRILPCRPKGEARRGDRPEWEYVESNGKLTVEPSLLATDTGFHTSFTWQCDYSIKPCDAAMCDYFDEINPTVKTDWGRAA